MKVKIESCSDADADRTALVDAVVNVPTGAGSLKLLLEDQVLDAFDAGPAVSDVRNIRREAMGMGVEGLMWDSDEATNPKVTYTVQVSSDGGETWKTIIVGSKTPEVTFDSADYPGARAIKVRVTETNGFEISNETVQDVSLE